MTAFSKNSTSVIISKNAGFISIPKNHFSIECLIEMEATVVILKKVNQTNEPL